mmetsp:Transcript_921/g.2726  ORF Transcript_921/g.2726 Transcript_921/m.2726 type:complete len:463 (-) Transcript_921:462-1850(-)
MKWIYNIISQLANKHPKPTGHRPRGEAKQQEEHHHGPRDLGLLAVEQSRSSGHGGGRQIPVRQTQADSYNEERDVLKALLHEDGIDGNKGDPHDAEGEQDAPVLHQVPLRAHLPGHVPQVEHCDQEQRVPRLEGRGLEVFRQDAREDGQGDEVPDEDGHGVHPQLLEDGHQLHLPDPLKARFPLVLLLRDRFDCSGVLQRVVLLCDFYVHAAAVTVLAAAVSLEQRRPGAPPESLLLSLPLYDGQVGHHPLVQVHTEQGEDAARCKVNVHPLNQPVGGVPESDLGPDSQDRDEDARDRRAHDEGTGVLDRQRSGQAKQASLHKPIRHGDHRDEAERYYHRQLVPPPVHVIVVREQRPVGHRHAHHGDRVRGEPEQDSRVQVDARAKLHEKSRHDHIDCHVKHRYHPVRVVLRVKVLVVVHCRHKGVPRQQGAYSKAKHAQVRQPIFRKLVHLFHQAKTVSPL